MAEPEKDAFLEIEAASPFLGYLVRLTVNLVTLHSKTRLPEVRRSGFLYGRDGKVHLVSAAHKLGVVQWKIETRLTQEGRRVSLLQVLTVHLLRAYAGDGNYSEVDLFWVEIELEKRRAELHADPNNEGPRFNPEVYSGSLGFVPSAAGLYTFAAYNRAEFIGRWIVGLERQLTTETMTFDGFEEKRHDRLNLYRFRLIDGHKGHEVYEGASGAPIATTDRKIVSIVLHGDPAENVIWGLPLARYAHAIGRLKDSEPPDGPGVPAAAH